MFNKYKAKFFVIRMVMILFKNGINSGIGEVKCRKNQ